jgi:hypothetical protein
MHIHLNKINTSVGMKPSTKHNSAYESHPHTLIMCVTSLKWPWVKGSVRIHRPRMQSSLSTTRRINPQQLRVLVRSSFCGLAWHSLHTTLDRIWPTVLSTVHWLRASGILWGEQGVQISPRLLPCPVLGMSFSLLHERIKCIWDAHKVDHTTSCKALGFLSVNKTKILTLI